jgi:hypothetical protein
MNYEVVIASPPSSRRIAKAIAEPWSHGDGGGS